MCSAICSPEGGDELLGERFRLVEPEGEEADLRDQRVVRHHHRHRTEERLPNKEGRAEGPAAPRRRGRPCQARGARAFRLSGSSVRPAYPGFIVTKVAVLGSSLTVDPSNSKVSTSAMIACAIRRSSDGDHGAITNATQGGNMWASSR